MTWSFDQTLRALRRRTLPAGRRLPALPPPASTADGRPTRPDRLSIWPIEDERFGIDVLYLGEQGHRRARVVTRQIESLGLAAQLIREPEGGWLVRFGPVSRAEMLAVLNGFVW